VLIGAWGEEAVELLARAARGAGEPLDRLGSLALLGAPGATEAGWRCWLSGRLTNADELRRRFPAAQPEPVAAVALAHARLGLPACDLLRGTFILVAADPERGTASAARDQLGGRPLVYTRVGRGVLFAEHERDLIARLPTVPGPDRRAVTQWIDGGGLPGRRSFYAGIERVPPGHRLALSGFGAALERYWTPRYEGTAAGTRGELAERLRSETFAAVDRAAAGARSPAVRLSGGLDSACVAAGLAVRPAGEGALAISAIFPGSPETDEGDLIEAAARQAGLTSELVSFAEPGSILAPALSYVERWRLPSVTPNLFVWEPTMARARELGVDVMLDGEGGDELFGLAPYLIADALRAGRFRSAWKLSAGIPGIGEEPDPRTRLRALRVFGTSALTPQWARRRRRRRRAAAGSEGSLLDREDRLAIADEDERSAWRALEGPHWWRALAADLIGGGDELEVAGQLRRESIDGGIDRRHPLLFDLDLVCVVLANPPQLQFDPIRDRSLLRDALAGYIPEQVRGRYAKSYFTPLLAAALSGPDRGSLAGPLLEPAAPVRSFMRAEALDSILAQSGPIPPARAMSLWRIAMVDAWLRSVWPE
jgi:asparagine synthase (glutamine-hydrolysing)